MALTYTTPVTTDGVVESATPTLGGTEWETDELLANDGGTDFYMTWDTTHVYFAVTGPYADHEDGDYDWFIAIDVDQIPGSGATQDGYAHVNFTGDFLPDYVIYRTGGFGWYETTEWDGSQWVWRGWNDSCSYGGYDGNLTSEMCMAFGNIGDPDTMAVVSWITDEDQTQVVASYPTANPIGNPPQTMEYFFVAEDLGEGVSPVTLPVRPTPGDAVVDNERSFPLTCRGLADITPGNCGSTTSMTFFYTTDGSDPTEASPFITGTYDTCRVGADTTDTFYAIFPAPDDSTVRWIAKGTASNGISDTSDDIQEFVQGGTAWVGNEGSSPNTCTIWAEIYIGDGGVDSWMKFNYTTDGSDPRTSGTATEVDGTFDTMLGNNDKFYAVLSSPPSGTSVNWYAFGRDTNDNFAESDTFFTFVQGDTAEYFNMTCEPDSNFVYGDVVPGGIGAGMDFYWTTDGSDPKTSPDAYMAKGFFVEDRADTGRFAAYLTADTGETITWYAHAYGSDNSFSDTPNYTCTAGVTSGPTLCNLTCIPDSLIVRASISPRGFGSEITFFASLGEDPQTAEYVAELPGSFVADVDASGDCPVPVGVFQAVLPGSLAVGDSVMWYAHGYYQPDNKYNGLFGDSPTQTCVVNASAAGIPDSRGTMMERISTVPNPFGSTTNISFSLTRAAKVTITAYDIRGRMVARIHDGVLPEGQHTVTWDGKSAKEQDLPSGIYFYRMAAGDFETTTKVILIR
jgi:hypothetical protein